MHTEQAVINALKGILEEFHEVQLVRVTEYDYSGQVFERPDQVEMDLIIRNSSTIFAEISLGEQG